MKRGKKTTVSKESIKKMMDKETKLKFDKELVYVKPFKVIHYCTQGKGPHLKNHISISTRVAKMSQDGCDRDRSLA